MKGEKVDGGGGGRKQRLARDRFRSDLRNTPSTLTKNRLWDKKIGVLSGEGKELHFLRSVESSLVHNYTFFDLTY